MKFLEKWGLIQEIQHEFLFKKTEKKEWKIINKGISD